MHNPFKRNGHHNFPGVVIPLASAPPRSSQSPSPSPVENKLGPDEKADDRSLDQASCEKGIGPVPEYTHLTLEALRAEVETDLAASGHDSAYDRMF